MRAPWHNIPVLSFLWLRGRCADCGGRISWQYPLLELTAALLGVAVAWRFGVGMPALLALVYTWCLLALTGIDWRTQYLPDGITLPLLWLGLLASLGGWFATPADAIVGAAAGYLLLWAVYHGFRLITGKQGMGHGDFKLLAAIGAWLGWQALPQVILLASAVGAVVGVALTVFGRLGRDVPMPFGPFLAAAGWLALMAGDSIARVYFQLSGLN
jgi:leader peptidase (prepilin peptidase)/N-methyltransferase